MADVKIDSPSSRPRHKTLRAVGYIAVVLVAAVIAAAAWYSLTRPPPRTIQPAAEAPTEQFSYDPFAAVLRQFVDERGMVDYADLKQRRQDLDAFVAHLANLQREEYQRWNDSDQIALWINSYNALALLLIIEHYPITRSAQPEGLAFPANSIWQIPGRFDKVKFVVMGREMSLDEIEHATLRKDFKEPRIHVALVCAAKGCPPLRREPYRGETLNEQLDDQSKRFVSDPRHFRIDREDNAVHLSSIFKWFGEDFIKRYAPQTGFGEYSEKERAVLHFISRYLSPEDGEYLRAGDYGVKYLSYDWSLNEKSNK